MSGRPLFLQLVYLGVEAPLKALSGVSRAELQTQMITPPGAGRDEAEALVVRYFQEATVVAAHHAAEASSWSPGPLPKLMRYLVFMWSL